MIIALVAIVALLGGGSAVAIVGFGVLEGKDTETITGSFTLFDIGSVDGEITSCQGTGGYSDVDAGMDVTVRDAEGKIVGSSSVRHMTEAEIRELLSDDDDSEASGSADESSDSDVDDMLESLDGSVCPLAFEVDVARVDFYEIKIGRRGELSASRKELEEDDWTVDYTLGD